MIKTGIIAFIGKPNVGKSSLFNSFFKYDVAITSAKPQTTRWNIKSVYQTDEYAVGLIDTPGVHMAKNLLDTYANKQARSSLKETDIILGMFDLSSPLDEVDEMVIKTLNRLKNKKVLICLTKKDLVNNAVIEKTKSELSKKITLDNYIFLPINTKEKNTKKIILDAINNSLTSAEEPLVTQSWANEDNDILLIREAVRKACIETLRDEIVYGVDVEVEERKYDQQSKIFYAYANIIVEKENHKKIIIGANGKTIKKIGVNARERLLEIFDCKIYLELFVKVRKNWRNNPLYLTNMGYK